MSSRRQKFFRFRRVNKVAQNSRLGLLFSVLRGVAALQVATGHLRNETFPSLRTLHDPTLYYQALAFVTGFAHQAVVVFFLLSGWLVGGNLLNDWNKPGAISSYFLDRVTRFWTVLFPSLLLALGVAAKTGAIEVGKFDFTGTNDYSAITFLGNLVGLQTVCVKTFAGNYSLWSLSSEMWYYIAFPLLLGAAFGTRVTRFFMVIGLMALGVFLPYAMTLYFTLWLLGAAFSRVQFTCTRRTRLALILATVSISVFYRITGSNADLVPASFFQDLVCGLPFLLVLSNVSTQPESMPHYTRLRAVANFFANISFTLYVIHVPVIRFLRFMMRQAFGRDRLDPGAISDYAIFFGMLVGVVTTAYAFYMAFEAQTPQIRKFLRRRFFLPARFKPAQQASADG